MNFSASFIRIAFLSWPLVACLPVQSQNQDEVKYFGSGWPIALVDAACGEDEQCQTELANCPPGTDGSCSAQAALCTAPGGSQGQFTNAWPCTVRTVSLSGNNLTQVRWPDAQTIETDLTQSTTGANGVCVPTRSGRLCYRPVTQAAELKRWAAGTAAWQQAQTIAE